LKDLWPYKYGQFKNGRLDGHGRMYETQLNVLDGIFRQDNLLEGFCIDYFKNKMYLANKKKEKQN
jgi:hypothetical protein